MLFLIAIQLYTVPIVLKNLGVSDYGLYNVIGGVVAAFSFLGGALASGTQRYLSFAIGKNDDRLLNDTFQTTLTLYLAFGFVTLLLLEVIGLWFVSYKLNIPAGRFSAALYLFQFSTFTFILNLLSIPFNSVIIAHERMGVYAYVSVFEGIAKFIIAFSLPFWPLDKLVYYGGLLFILSVVIQLFYIFYCRKSFRECSHLHFCWNSKLGIKLLTYSGWNLVGVVSLLGRNQGLSIVMNLFFGTLLNAAHAIANQINVVINQFINNFYMATRPAITKYCASGNIDEMWLLVFRSAKLAFFLLTILCVPAISEMNYILGLWLGKVPDYTVQIVICLLSVSLIETLVNQIISAFQAENKIKQYQKYSSSIVLLVVPVSYFILKYIKCSPLLPYEISIVLSVLYDIVILYIALKDIGMDSIAYCRKVILPNVGVFVLVLLGTLEIRSLFDPSFFRLILSGCSSFLLTCVSAWILGLNRFEKQFVINIIKSKFKREKYEKSKNYC